MCVCRKLEEWYTNFTHCNTLLSKDSLFPENECQAYEHKCLWIPSSFKKTRGACAEAIHTKILCSLSTV